MGKKGGAGCAGARKEEKGDGGAVAYGWLMCLRCLNELLSKRFVPPDFLGYVSKMFLGISTLMGSFSSDAAAAVIEETIPA